MHGRARRPSTGGAGDALLDDALAARPAAPSRRAGATLSPALLWMLFGGFVLVTLGALGVRTLVPPDEGRYAEIGREMFVSGDWITTRLNGIKYFEKPPLQAWMNALTFTLFGLGEWQARLWTGVCGILGVVMTAWAGRVVFSPRIGLYAGLVLASTLFWLAAGQINSLDMSLSGMMATCLAAVLIAQRDGATAGQRRAWMLVAWAAMALAALAKGLVGVVLPGAVLVLYGAAARDWRVWTRLHMGKGLLLFFAVAAPWFILVAQRNPEQPHFFFIHEHFDRFLSPGHQREGPWYAFILLLLPGLLPWLGWLPHALVEGARRAPGRFQPRLLLLIWFAFILVFFSMSSSKLPGYIVPVFPAVALLTALCLDAAGRRPHMVAAALLAAVGALLVVAVPVALATGAAGSAPHSLRSYQPWLMFAGCILLVGGCLAWCQAARVQRDQTVLTMAVAGFLATHLIVAGFEVYGKDRAGTALLPAIRAELTPSTKLYALGRYEQSLTFYLGRPAILVEYVDEFGFGLRQEPGLALSGLEEFVVLWRRDAAAGPPSMAIASQAVYDRLRQRGVPMRLVARDGRRIVISNQLTKGLP
ncbi:4-amino-4-deoxy-L-arabinose transferase [Duganella sp. CF517]|nr:4-amino-4-deoxy-L-arabinose transferase [Duganella sp. CF517]